MAKEKPRAPKVENVPEPEPKWRRRKDARPEELVAAALELFVEQGFAGTRMRDVAKRAGVSKGTVYLYFKSKEELLRSAVRDSIVPIVDEGDDIEVEAEGTSAELLRQLLERWLKEFEERGLAGVPKLVMSEAGNFPEIAQDYMTHVVQRSRRLFVRVIKRGIREGEFRKVDAREAVHVLLAPVLYAQIHAASLGPYDPELMGRARFLDMHLDFFLRAVRVEPGVAK